MRASTRTEISKLHQRLGATMIYATHDQIEAMTMGDRTCWRDEGRRHNAGGAAARPTTGRRIAQCRLHRFADEFLSRHGAPHQPRIGIRRDERQRRRPPHPLDARLTRIAQAAVDQPIVFGICAEDVLGHERRACSHSVAIEVAEPMGAETFPTSPARRPSSSNT